MQISFCTRLPLRFSLKTTHVRYFIVIVWIPETSTRPIENQITLEHMKNMSFVTMTFVLILIMITHEIC